MTLQAYRTGPVPQFALVLLTAVLSTFTAASAPRFAVDVWTSEQGLPQNSVSSILQTRDGFLWLGTLNGLARFDGVRFEVFDENNTPGLDSARIVKLYEDSRERLWISTGSGGILLVSKDGQTMQASLAAADPEARVRSFTEDSSGAVWLFTADGQLGRFQEGRMDVWNLSAGIPGTSRNLAIDNAGVLWAGTDQSLAAFGPTPVKGVDLPSAYPPALARLDYLFPSRDGGVWRFGNRSIEKWRGDTLERKVASYPWGPEVAISAACEDAEGNLLVGTYGYPGGGVYWIPQAGEAAQVEGLSHNSVLSMAIDREGNTWVGTDGGGLNRLRPLTFNVLPGSVDSTVQSVVEDPSGGLWIGYNGDRIVHWTTNDFTHFSLGRNQPNLVVRSVFVNRAGDVLAGTFGSGLYRLRFGAFEPDPDYSAVGNPSISAIYEDRSGTLWLGTQGGLAYLRGGFWRTFSRLDGLSANTVQAIAEDREGNLWAGTSAGLNRIAGNSVTVFRREDGLPANNVTALFEDSEGSLWAGTTAGLALWKNGRWHAITREHGLAANSIRYIIDDELGWLWLGSNAGLMRVPKQALHDLADERNPSVAVRVFGRAEGVPSSDSSQGSQPAAARSKDGRLWFPTIKGLAFIDPKEIQPNTNAPPVLIESVHLDGRSQTTNTLRISGPRKLTVPAGRESLEIRFLCLHLDAPENCRFKYRLEGHETSWNTGVGNRGVAHYTRLPAGSYTFRVIAGNQDNVWNEEGASLAVTVLPPFWRTWWFITLSTILGLGLVAAVATFVSTQKLQRQLAGLRQKELLERERSRIARDLHDQLGANLTQVALLGEMAEADKELPEEVENHARQISSTARETTRALDEIVWTVNPANDTLEGLINYICKYAQEYFALADLKYRFEVPTELPATRITPELRHHAFLAAKEAINNVVKHAHATSAWLRLKLEPAGFILEIADDGRGLPVGADRKGRSGLKNMRSRMEEIGGIFTIESAPGGGTIVRLGGPIATPAPASEV